MQQSEEKILNYLNGFCSEEDKASMERWMEDSESNRKEFEQVKKLYELSGDEDSSFTPDVDMAWNELSSRVFEDNDSSEVQGEDTKVRKVDFRIYYKVAAALVIAIGLGYILTINNTQQEFVTLSTQAEEIKEVTLSDGTKVWLNENSVFKYPKNFEEDARDVALNGEAFFEVNKDPKRPFTIASKSTYTQVLGTSFNLTTRKDFARVDVVTGKVALVDQDGEDKVVLVKGQTGTFKNGTMSKSEDADPNALAWRTGKLVFKSATLSEVVKVLEQHYDVRIGLDDNVKGCLITSEFDQASIEEVLEILKIIAKITNTSEDGDIHLTGPGC